MIGNFYSSVSNGNIIDKCSHNQRYVPELPCLLKSNFLSEFRTALEKTKVRLNLGIADSDTLYWGNIQGDIAEQADISGYINSLLAFNYEIQNNFDAGDHFQNITNVREAAITCLDYLSKFKGEGAEIAALETKIKEILRNLYAVDNLDDVSTSEGGVINELLQDVLALQQKVGNPSTTVTEIETLLNQVEERVNSINEVLTDINSLLVKYQPTDGTTNALEIVEDIVTTESRPVLDDYGNPTYDDFGQQIFQDVQVTTKGGLYVKDLQPQIDALNAEINGSDGKLSLLLQLVDSNAEKIQTNKEGIDDINTTEIPRINSELADIRNKYISKESLGSSSPIVTTEKLSEELTDYIKKNTNASVVGLTSLNDAIRIDKPFNPVVNKPLDPRRYVLTKQDLLSIDAWDGMEVIVIDSAMLYICTDSTKSKLSTFEAWKTQDSLKIEIVTLEKFTELKEANKLSEDIYYYIQEEEINYVPIPDIKEYGVATETIDGKGNKHVTITYDEAAYNQAVLNYQKNIGLLDRQYLSAAWGEEFNNRLLYKASAAELDALRARMYNVENFFSGDSTGSIKDIQDSILNIYTPAVVNDKNEVITPASGLLVRVESRVESRVEALEAAVEELQNVDVVTWDLIGANNTIVTEDKLNETVERYVEKNSIASLDGITSLNDTITVNKPLSPTFLAPLDSRHYVDSYNDLFRISPDTAYEGMEVIVKQDAIIYMLDSISNITNQLGWKAVGAASIIELTLEEFNLRKDNTNEDGSSKGHTYQDGAYEGKPIPTLLASTYYFIQEGDISVPVAPNEADFTDLNGVLDTEKYAEALKKWREGTYYLLQQYMPASWGLDLENTVKSKVSNADFSVLTGKVESLKEEVDTKATIASLDLSNQEIEDLKSAVAVLNSYFDSPDPSGNTPNVLTAIATLDAAIKEIYNNLNNTGLLVNTNNEIQTIKNHLYGTNTEQSKFVSWEDLGADTSDRLELQDGKTLFVKTSVYESDKTAAVNHFETKELQLNGLNNNAVLHPLNDRITVNDNPVALQDELPKTIEFDSYSDYETWKNSSEYTTWAAENNPDEWYFLIKNVNGALPTRNPGETDEQYNARVEPLKKSMWITAYDADNLYATKAELSTVSARIDPAIQSAKTELDTKIQKNADDIVTVSARIDPAIQSAKTELDTKIQKNADDIVTINTTLVQHANNLDATISDYTTKVTNLRNEFVNVWGNYYNLYTLTFTELNVILNEQNTFITEALETYVNSKVESEVKSKIDKSLLDLLWDGYITINLGNTFYDPIQTILNKFYVKLLGTGTDDDTDVYSLKNLLKNIETRETKEKHQLDYDTLHNYTDEREEATKLYSDEQNDYLWQQSVEAFTNAIPVMYQELGELKNAGALIPGRYYKIMDYVTTTKQPDTNVIWHPYYVIVLADDAWTLNENAHAAKPVVEKGPTTEDYWKNCNLKAWEIKYRYENDTDHFAWAVTDYRVTQYFVFNGKSKNVGDTISLDQYESLSDENKTKCYPIGRGVIYYMKDEYGNECPYDFKTILFKRYKVATVAAPLIDWIRSSGYISAKAFNKHIPQAALGLMMYDSFDTSSGSGEDAKWFYTFNRSETEPIEATVYNANQHTNFVRDNKLGLLPQMAHIVEVSGEGVNQSFLSNNVFIGELIAANICNSAGFVYNTFYGYWINDLGLKQTDLIGYNTFGDNFAFNICRDRFLLNIFKNMTMYNVFKSDFRYNTTDDLFLLNRILDGANFNKFGVYFNNNDIYDKFIYNVIGNNCTNVVFDVAFQENVVGNQFTNCNLTVQYLRRCSFADGISNLNIADSSRKSGEKNGVTKYYQNFRFNTVYGTKLKDIDFSGRTFINSADYSSVDLDVDLDYILVFENVPPPHEDIVLIWSQAGFAYYFYDTTVKTIQTINEKLNKIQAWSRVIVNSLRKINATLDDEHKLNNATELPELSWNATYTVNNNNN